MSSNKKRNIKRKILITGASGFIGSFTVEEGLKNGFDVYAGIRKSSDLSYLKDERINYFEIDLSDKEKLKRDIIAVGGFDFVIHIAGITKTCKKENFEYVNYKLSKNLIDALIESKLIPLKYIQISSLAAYGPGNSMQARPIQDSDTPKPISDYGKSKLKLEKYLKSLEDFPYLIFRPTGVYGPREKDFYVMYKSINSGIETYVGTRNQYLTFIYVKDLVYLLIDVLNSDFIQKSYFVTDLESYTAKDLNETIKNALNKKTISIVFPKFFVKILAWMSEKSSCLFFGKNATLNIDKYREISQKNWLCDSFDLVTDFDFKPRYNLEEGIFETIAWYKKHNKL